MCGKGMARKSSRFQFYQLLGRQIKIRMQIWLPYQRILQNSIYQVLSRDFVRQGGMGLENTFFFIDPEELCSGISKIQILSFKIQISFKIIFYIQDIQQTSMNQQEIQLLQQYNKQLEAENKAKSLEIQALTKNYIACSQQLSRLQYLKLIHQQEQVSPILKRESIVEKCRNCESNANLLQQKQKILKKLDHKMKEQEKSIKQLSQKLEKALQQNDQLKQKKSEGVVGAKNKNNLQINHRNLQTADKKILQDKIQFLQKRVFSLENSNRILREQILMYIQNRNSHSSSQIYHKLEGPLHKTITVVSPNHSYTYNDQQILSQNKVSILKESFRKKQPEYRNDSLILQNVLSPLKKNYLYRKPEYDKRNLIDEHNQALQRKIRILKKQNSRLKQQISFIA